uniref:Uncharacterized protein n=1 Tax=Macaca fascicularis TaxID=9541 RepID=A0A7N9CGW9_MACFA
MNISEYAILYLQDKYPEVSFLGQRVCAFTVLIGLSNFSSEKLHWFILPQTIAASPHFGQH